MTFNEGNWNKKIDTRDFIIRNYTPYDGDERFRDERRREVDDIAEQKVGERRSDARRDRTEEGTEQPTRQQDDDVPEVEISHADGNGDSISDDEAERAECRRKGYFFCRNKFHNSFSVCWPL